MLFRRALRGGVAARPGGIALAAVAAAAPPRAWCSPLIRRAAAAGSPTAPRPLRATQTRHHTTMAHHNCAWRATARDHSTHSNYKDAVVKHMDFDWTVDFKASTIAGSVTLTVEAKHAGVDEVVLDTRNIHIKAVAVDGTAAEYSLGEHTDAFGAALTIKIPTAIGASKAAGQTFRVAVTYATDPKCSALAWLAPEQTNLGDRAEHPYLFSQCQAIHARSLFPCMDSPGVRATYSAKVKVPKALQALMSALMKKSYTEGEHKVCEFDQPVPISSYLVAIIVGNVVKRDISPRVAVWSEADNVDLAAFDFSDTEKFVACGEELVGPYVWGRYDIVCLPGSFPYGGMENPCLTFVTPSLITGDKSLADVICHEVAHSWTGNLVGPETWEDFYLNEGFTMFLQRKIMSRIHKPEYFNFDAQLGLKHLLDDVDRYGHDHPYTALRPDLKGVDPDDAFSSVPYEKGFCFIVHLERLVNAAVDDDASFEKWLHSYIQTYKFKAITSADMLGHLREYYKDDAAAAKALAAVDLKAWLDTPGMPLVTPDFPSPLTDACVALAAKWNAGGEGTGPGDMEGWTSAQKCLFLSTLDADKLTDASVAKMNDFYTFVGTNSEIQFLYLKLCISKAVTSFDYIPPLEKFLASFGRMKFTRPLYRALKEVDEARAQAIFKKHQHKYHQICQKMVGKDLGLC